MDLVWDAENRLIQVTPRNPSGKETRNRDIHFEYDYMSRRIRKYTYAWSGSAWDTSIAEDTRFVYDGWNVVQEIDGLSPGTTGVTDVIRNYTWGLDLSGQNGNPSVGGIHGAGGIGGLLATHWTKGTTSASDDSKYVYFYDANGNVGQMMDVVSTSSGYGTIAAQYEYYPFGGLLDAQGVAAEGNPFRFSTKYRDNEDGSYYYGYRYLRTKHGRWLNRDPIGEIGSINIFSFSANNAQNLVDFLGLDPAPTGNAASTANNCKTCVGPPAEIISWMEGGPGYGWGINHSTNPRPPSAFDHGITGNPGTNNLRDFLSGKEYRNHMGVIPIITCCCKRPGEGKNYLVNAKEVTTQNVGYTNLGWDHYFFQGHGSRTVTMTRTDSCATITVRAKFQVSQGLNLGQGAYSWDLMPYAWSEINYTICCDGTTNVSYSGSTVPSHEGYLDAHRTTSVSMNGNNNAGRLKRFLNGGISKQAFGGWFGGVSGLKGAICTE